MSLSHMPVRDLDAARPPVRARAVEHDRRSTRLRAALTPYTRRSTALGLAIFAIDIVAYLAAMAGAVLFENFLLSLLCAVVAGAQISALFVIGHDAAHGSYTDSRALNSLLGRLAFLPALHNFSLWQIVHNELHHRFTCLKGLNSWSPFSKAEFDALPKWRQIVERLYRTPLGLGLYYLVERWWKYKFFPSKRPVERYKAVYWLDFGLLAAYLAVFLAGLAYVGGTVSQGGAVSAVAFGFVLPFVVWNAAMGFTVYLQHTHPRVPWMKNFAQWHRLGGQEEVTVEARFPRWYGLLSNDIMEHTAHHVHPGVPLYNLKKAQDALAELLGDRLVRVPFSPLAFVSTMARCKLYDYEQHRWLNFAGEPTSDCTLPAGYPDMVESPAASEPRVA